MLVTQKIRRMMICHKLEKWTSHFLSFTILVLMFLVHNSSAQKTAVSLSARKGVQSIEHGEGAEKLDVEYEGKIEFSDDDKLIKSISRGGYLKISNVTFGTRREILAEGIGGEISYQYFKGGRRVDFETEGKNWLSDVLIEVIRATGIDAEARVKRFHTNGGVRAVLKEVGKIRSDFVSHIYLQELLFIDNFNDAELLRIAAYIPEKLDSDYYINEIFKDHGFRLLKNNQAVGAFVLAALESMDSDFYVTEILKKALRRNMSNVVLDKVLSKVQKMESDHHKVTVLEYVFGTDLTDTHLLSVLNSVRNIESDYYKKVLLEEACRLVNQAASTVKVSYHKTAKEIKSDTDYGKIARCVK